jgi:hypothetical protein
MKTYEAKIRSFHQQIVIASDWTYATYEAIKNRVTTGEKWSRDWGRSSGVPREMYLIVTYYMQRVEAEISTYAITLNCVGMVRGDMKTTKFDREVAQAEEKLRTMFGQE